MTGVQTCALPISSIATRALNSGLYCFLVVVIDLSFVNDSVEILAYCLV